MSIVWTIEQHLINPACKPLFSNDNNRLLTKLFFAADVNIMPIRALFVLLTLGMSGYAAEQFSVKILDRQDRAAEYTYSIPGHSNSTSTTDANCYGIANTANCTATTRTTGSSTPARTGSYPVRGATLSLQLPDGRVAVVNCDSKLNWTDFSKPNQVRRSCKIPLVENIQAEFDRDKAKLKWSVSIDGRKMESETYKILAVIDNPNQAGVIQ